MKIIINIIIKNIAIKNPHIIGLILFVCFILYPSIINAQDPTAAIPNHLYDTNGGSNDEYGSAVAISNDWVIIGARRNSIGSGGLEGKVFFWQFKESTSEWDSISSTRSNEADQGEYFGQSVAIDGNRAIIGAHEDENNGKVGAGAAFIFEYIENEWIQTAKLDAGADAGAVDRFGVDVDIDGDWVVIGAYFDDDKGTSSGSAYLFHYNGSSWDLNQKIHARDGEPGDHFGEHVAISGTTVVIGARDKDNHAGAAYIYEFDGINWIPKSKLIRGGGGADYYFGQSVDIDGDVIIVGADAGYIFEKPTDGWHDSTTTETEDAKLITPNAEKDDRLGWAVAIKDNIAIVSADYLDEPTNNEGGVFVYTKEKGKKWADKMEEIAWLEAKNPTTGSHFGYAVDLDNNTLLVGADYGEGHKDDTGAAYVVTLTPKPVINFQAGNDSLENQIRLSWDHETDEYSNYNVTKYNLYRDNDDKTFSVHTDLDNLEYYDGNYPGTVQTYRIHAANDFGESEPVYDVGRAKPNGRISGWIHAGSAHVPGIYTYINPLGNAIILNGIEDFASIRNNLILPRNSITIETWIKPETQEQTWTHIFAAGDKIDLVARTNSENKFSFWLSIEGVPYSLVDDDTWQAGEWYHVTGVYNGSVMTLYVNGKAKKSLPISGQIDTSNSNINIGWKTNINNEHFKGIIDELRIWEVGRTGNEIQRDMDRLLRGTEQGLVGYWRMDAGKGLGLYDYTKNNNNGYLSSNLLWAGEKAPVWQGDVSGKNGRYAIDSIYYKDESSFIVIPDTTGNHLFNPEQSEPITLNKNEGEHTANWDFEDISQFAIEGRAVFRGIDYGIGQVELLNQNNFVWGETDSTGFYSIAFQAGEYTIKPAYYDHTFIPSDTTVLVTEPISDLIFEDTTHYTLQGRVVGGQAGFDIGEATLFINGPDDCFDRTIVTSGGNFQVRLPALQEITVTVTKIGDDLVEDFLDDHGGKLNTFKTISLVEGDDSLDFVYHAEPQVVIEGLPDPSTIYDVPVLAQFSKQSLSIKIVEDYGQDRICLADSGLITIYNDIDDESLPVEVSIDDTSEYYLHQFITGMPNVLPWGDHPYQKHLQIYANTSGGTVEQNTWIIVTGYRPREQRFTTVSPEIPLLILHDPPGDASYSYFADQTTTSINFGLSMQKDNSLRTYGAISAGGGCSLYAGSPFTFTKVLEIEYYASIGAAFEVGTSLKSQFEQQFTLTNTEYFATSADEAGIGAPADVFVGAAFNLIYALADILEINDMGEVELSKSIVYGANEDEGMFKTTYIYTQKYIKKSLIPELQEIIRLTTDADTIRYYQDQIDVWEQTLALNDSLKENAIDVDAFKDNISFSGLAEYQGTSEISLQKSFSLDCNLYIESTVATEAGLFVSAPGASTGLVAGVQVKSKFTIGSSFTTSGISTNTVGFRLYDNDDIDKFWIKIKGDPMYGTPVFQNQPGCHTSYPWEPNTTPHDGPRLAIDHNILNEIDPEDQGVFQLTLTNASPTGQTRDYKLVDIPVSNPDGAILKINGNSFKDLFPYTIPADQSRTVTMTVDNGPLAYDYEDLQIALCSLQDDQIADTVTFSVHFSPPCSPVTLNQPEDNWILNKQMHDSLKIVLKDYDKTKMTNVIMQYSPTNRNEWKNALVVAAANLPSNNAELIMNTRSLNEGTYDLRAKVTWDQVEGATYSLKARGIIDRTAPQILGKTQPSDGILHPGDNISVKFNENIDQGTLSTDNVTLRNSLTGAIIPIEIVTSEREVVINPTIASNLIENQNLQVSLINIQDQYGNGSGESIVWSFYVNQNPVYWNTSTITKTALEGEGCSFWAKLINDGNENVNFNLSNLPWLSADISSGWINKGEEKVIQFTMDPGLTSGYYRDTLFAEMSKGDEPLILDIHIQNKPPEWTFDPAAFNYNMTLTAGFYIDDIPFSEENDIVAAFAGDTLCGKVKVQKMVPHDEYVAFLMIHSNKIRAENISLVIWDASEGQERSIAEKLTFVADTIYGSASNPDSLHISGALLQTIHLADNWSWFSLAVETRDMSTTAILDRLRPGNGDLVKGHTSYAQYLPGLGWVGELDSLRIGNGFKIKLSAIKDLNYIGKPVTDIHWPIEIESGWNWIGYFPDEALNINIALASLNATVEDGDQIKNEDSFATYNAANSQWEGTLNEMKLGEAYMLKVANDGIINYPGLSGQKITLAKFLSAKAMLASAPDWQVNAATYEYSMNVTSKLTIDGLPVVNANTLLAAFINDECRGISKPVFVRDKWMFFSTIFSNIAEDDSIQFKVYDAENDQVRDVDVKVAYNADQVIGTPASPMILWIGIRTGLEDENDLPREFALEQNYPNPFNPVTTIRYALKQPEDVKLILYDMLGQKVRVLVDESQKAGWYDVKLNAKDLASGVYIYRIKAGKFVKAHKLVVIK